MVTTEVVITSLAVSMGRLLWVGERRSAAGYPNPAFGFRGFLPRGVELLEVCDKVVDALLVLETGIDHLGAGDLGLWVLDVLLEDRLVPGDAGALVGRRVVVALDRS